MNQDPMIVRRYLAWTQGARANERAAAVSALARAYLQGQLGSADSREAIDAMMTALDDPATEVRLALAEAVAAEERAPKPLVRALAADQSRVAAPILAFSPLLSDAELIDCLCVGDRVAQQAIASRPWLSSDLTAALAEIGLPEAVVLLLDNAGAEWDASALDRAAMRFVGDADIRGRLLVREDLPIGARQRLVKAVSDALAAFVAERGWLPEARSERLGQEALEAGSILIAGDSDLETVVALARHLRASGQLTPALLLRSVLSGEKRLLEATLAELSGVPLARVQELVRGRGGFGIAAVYRKAGLPPVLAPAFEAALSALSDPTTILAPHTERRLQRDMVERVLVACAALSRPDLDRVVTLLARFQIEAAREDARAFTARILAEASVAEVATAPVDVEADVSQAVLPPSDALAALDEDIRLTLAARLAA